MERRICEHGSDCEGKNYRELPCNENPCPGKIWLRRNQQI